MTTINYNVAANIASNVITSNERAMDKAMNRLSTGKRINSGADDPGSFGVYSQAVVEGRMARTAAQSVNNAIGYLQAVDAASAQIESIMVRMKELAAQATNAMVTTNDRYALDAEFQSLGREWIRITADTQFNGASIMTGTDITVGYGTGSSEAILLDDWSVNGFTATTGEGTATGALVTGVTVSAGGPTAGFLGFGAANIAAAVDKPATGHENISTFGVAALSSAKLDRMLIHTGESRGRVGGQINALQATYDSLVANATGMEAAASKIGDANYARETTLLASQSIISQAATAILAQANARASTVLTLLK